MVLFFVLIGLLYFGRRAGSWVSKNYLYTSSLNRSAAMCVAWGLVVAGIIAFLIASAQPGPLFKMAVIYPVGCIVSIPNFGLSRKEAIEDTKRQSMVSFLPLAVYVAVSVLLSFLSPPHAVPV